MSFFVFTCVFYGYTHVIWSTADVGTWLHVERVSFADNESNDCLLHWHSKKETVFNLFNFEMNKSTTAEKNKIF